MSSVARRLFTSEFESIELKKKPQGNGVQSAKSNLGPHRTRFKKYFQNKWVDNHDLVGKCLLDLANAYQFHSNDPDSSNAYLKDRIYRPALLAFSKF